MDQQGVCFSTLCICCPKATNINLFRLIPKLQDSQDRAVVSEVIVMLMEEDGADVITGVENIAKGMLDTHLSRLHLSDVDYWTDSVRSDPSQKSSIAEMDRFLRLVQTCMKHGWGHEASELFRLSYEYARQQGPRPQPRHWTDTGLRAPALATFLVGHLATSLELAPASCIEQQQKLVEHIFRTYTVGTCPAPPIKPEGWASQPRGCSSLRTLNRNGACDICLPLDDFLVDPTRRTGEFCDTQTRRRHMERQLPAHLFDYRTDPSGRGGRQCQTLIVTKREKGADFNVAVERYKDEVMVFETKLLPFRKEIFRKLLGDNLYRELVLLESLPGSQAAQAARGDPPAVAGIKREAEDDSIFPPATRSYRRQ